MENADLLLLVAEDEDNDQAFIQRALRRSGVVNRVAVVGDGEEAAAYLRGFDPHESRQQHPLPRLVITDLKMPRMGGIELLAWMNARPAFRSIPVIVLKSSSDQSAVNAAFAHGAKGYMIKPVRFPELEKPMQTIAAYWRASCVPIPELPSQEET